MFASLYLGPLHYDTNATNTLWRRSSQMYTVRQCVIWKKKGFLLRSLFKIQFYTLQTTLYGMAKKCIGKARKPFMTSD